MSSAVESWLGYKYQEYRLVQRLLEADNTINIGFEMLDDLEEQLESSTVLEQNKVTTTTRNIVSNKSKDFWKTLSNWLDLIRDNKIDPYITTFLLYTNKSHSSQLLKLLVNAKTEKQARKAFESILTLVRIRSNNIKAYIDNFITMDERKFILIKNFDYIHGSGSVIQDLKNTYFQKRLGALEENIEDILDEIVGWVGNNLTRAAELRIPTIISAKAFGMRLGDIESKYRRRDILKFVCSRTNNSIDVKNDLTLEPIYIKQLKLIESNDTEIEEAAIAKLETKDAISKWTINGFIQESSYQDYQILLKHKWQIHQKQIIIAHGHNVTNESLGALIYYKCLETFDNIKLENKTIESFFSHGTLQTLADDLSIGWHPEYKQKLGIIDDNT